jgi:hypothetical protein
MNRTLLIPRILNTHNLYTIPADNHWVCNSRLPNIRNSRLGGRHLSRCIRRRSYRHLLSITNNNIFPFSHIRNKSHLFPIKHDGRSLLPDTKGVAIRAVLHQ